MLDLKNSAHHSYVPHLVCPLFTDYIRNFRILALIDADVADDPDFTANTAVPAEFAGFSAVERFLGYLLIPM